MALRRIVQQEHTHGIVHVRHLTRSPLRGQEAPGEHHGPQSTHASFELQACHLRLGVRQKLPDLGRLRDVDCLLALPVFAQVQVSSFQRKELHHLQFPVVRGHPNGCPSGKIHVIDLGAVVYQVLQDVLMSRQNRLVEGRPPIEIHAIDVRTVRREACLQVAQIACFDDLKQRRNVLTDVDGVIANSCACDFMQGEGGFFVRGGRCQQTGEGSFGGTRRALALGMKDVAVAVVGDLARHASTRVHSVGQLGVLCEQVAHQS